MNINKLAGPHIYNQSIKFATYGKILLAAKVFMVCEGLEVSEILFMIILVVQWSKTKSHVYVIIVNRTIIVWTRSYYIKLIEPGIKNEIC